MIVAEAISGIQVEQVDNQRLEELGVKSWPIWEKEESTFDWRYDEQEICYFLAGEATIKTDEGEITVGHGDLVTFPKNLNCTWQVNRAVKKHFKFGEI